MKTKILPIKLFVSYLLLAVVTTLPLRGESPQAAERSHSTVTQVLGGLHSPRGLTFGPDERLYVAAAGDDTAGGSIIEINDPMSRHPKVRTVVSDLPTVGTDGEFLGVGSVVATGERERSGLYAIMGLSPHEAGEPFGRLLRIDKRGHVQNLVNVGSFDYDWSNAHKDLVPDQFPDANPYSIVQVRGHLYVVDAGANTLDEVMSDGSIRILAFFPNEHLADAVPTCACEGPDGALYVGTLALVDSVIIGPSAKVYRLDPAQANLAQPWKTPMTVWASGLFPINGCAFGHDRNFYASQLFTNPAHDFGAVFSDPHGDVVKIPFAHPGMHTVLTGGALSLAGGLAVDDDTVFVSSGTAHVAPGTGSIVRIEDRKHD